MPAFESQPGFRLGEHDAEQVLTGNGGHRLRLTCLGPSQAPAIVVYLHGPLSGPARFAAVAQQVQAQSEGRVSQLAYLQRGHHPEATEGAAMTSILDDLDLVLGHATGEVVLVVQSLAAIVLQEWLYRHRGDHTLAAAAIVALSPVTALPDPTGSLDPDPIHAVRQAGEVFIAQLSSEFGTDEAWLRDRFEPARRLLRSYRRQPADLAVVEDMLRATPTWVLSGRWDPIAGLGEVSEFSERIWAEHDTMPTAGHDLANHHRSEVADTITQAIQIVHESARYRIR
ncbi:alpha/beta hydrolase [Nocardia thailandica]|uniref:alpha/beta hydrolase n=1 Tax=Nocardia thailandica TaxID=257275 RepID=UPI0002E96509|nr:alpha/beta hydrolase [Nocardia thailandica]